MAAALIARAYVRRFSAHRPPQESRVARAVAMSCIACGVVLPFIPPAIVSSRERKSGYPNSNKPLPPLCFHAR